MVVTYWVEVTVAGVITTVVVVSIGVGVSGVGVPQPSEIRETNPS